MADITQFKPVSVQQVLANLDQYKYNPMAIQRAALDLLDEVTEGAIDIVDPTNPFIFLMESSAVNTALAIQESMVNLRKQYPRLAQTEDEVYHHMSDDDFIGRFATPTQTRFTFVIQVNDLLSKMVLDPIEDNYKVTIPRNTEFKVDNLTFSLQYPINIRRYHNGTIQISYDGNVPSPLQTLNGNIIDYSVRRDTSSVDWIFFTIPVHQFAVQSVYYALQKSAVFSQDIVFQDQFYYCRVYYRNTASQNRWIEIQTTHTDQVFDPFNPTAVLKVFDTYLNLFIPTVYLSSEKLSGDLRVDVYTTRGELTVNLSNYKLAAFQTLLKAIDEAADINDYTNALANISYYSYCDQLISGGTNGIDFETLRERVIYNSVGDRQLPITNAQLTAYVDNLGFDLVKNVDAITNRIFLATQRLPKPINTKLITAANIGIATLIANTTELALMDNVKPNGNRLTILSNNLYVLTNGIIRLLSNTEVNALKALTRLSLVETINTGQYIYCPFYYVLDSSIDEFQVRSYNLDYPEASQLSFVSQNQTIQLPVNTGNYALEKITNGYKLTVITKSGNFYKQVADGFVDMQLGYYPDGEKNLAFINGVLEGTTSEGERIYSFTFETNYDLDSDDRLCLINGKMFTNELLHTWINLDLDIYLFYTTSSVTTNFVPGPIDALIGKFLLPVNSVGVTQEKLTLKLGSSLKNLWSRTRSFPTGLDYQTYPADVPMLYEQRVYETDPNTGSIFSMPGGVLTYTVLHEIGDPVLDLSNNPVYKHRAGDVVLDSNGNPVVISLQDVDKEIDMLFVDGKYYFTDDPAFIEYRSELVKVLDTWITQDLISIQNKLLEQTKIYFFPKTTLGSVNVYTDSSATDALPSEQSLIVDLYVNNSVYLDTSIRNSLTQSTIQLLDQYINNTEVNISDIMVALRELYGHSVVSLKVSNLGGNKNYNIITLANEHNRLSLKKKLVLQEDTSLIIKEDVEVNFYNIERPLTE